MHKALLGKSGVGKALPLDTAVLTPNGWVRNGDLSIGDLVIGEDGSPTSILDVYKHSGLQMYKITFNDGTSVKSCKDHLWKIYTERLRTTKEGYRVFPTEKLAANCRRNEYKIPFVAPIEFEEKTYPLDPYILGYVIASSYHPICNPFIKCRSKDRNHFISIFARYINGYECKGKYTYFKVPQEDQYLIHTTFLDLDISNWVSIPSHLFFGSVEQRTKLLSGFIEGSDAEVKTETRVITVNNSSWIRNEIAALTRSLGHLAIDDGTSLKIRARNIKLFTAETNKYRFDKGCNINRYAKRIKSIEPCGIEDGMCIAVDNSSQTYVIQDYTVTHNSTTIKNLLKDDPSYGLKTASTGIAAINLQDEYGSATTVNSALGFFDTKELLLQTLNPGRMDDKVNDLADKYRYLIVDELSMVCSAQLDLIHRLFERVNQDRKRKGKQPIYLHLVGDFGQLPCVEGKPAFMAKCWNDFDVTYLTEVKRQSEIDFIKALHHIRMGDGLSALPYFESFVGFHRSLDKEFQGTTVLSKNKDVDSYNEQKLNKLKGDYIYIPSTRSGKQRPEWKNIPESLRIKVGALVLILMNNHKQGFANGDLGIVEEYDGFSEIAHIRLLRNNNIVQVEKVKVKNETLCTPCMGWIKYMPLRIGYATTTHKSQGLTLDNIQISMGDSFMSRCHGLFYVALSRAKVSTGIRLVGNADDFIRSPCFDSSFKGIVI